MTSAVNDLTGNVEFTPHNRFEECVVDDSSSLMMKLMLVAGGIGELRASAIFPKLRPPVFCYLFKQNTRKKGLRVFGFWICWRDGM